MQKTSTKRSYQITATETPRPGGGRPGLLTEQLVFRVSKAMRARVRRMQRERKLEKEADALRLIVREYFEGKD